ncbi:Ubiquitin carboxyl-terminal hydrolase 10-A [Triplophysa tibetana]|uniref:Ubiquitin carboxyl-terminal hydrolase n=1 Tax=Triplophysa tibetana TaxID=1572043 RepID=A0A5A9PNP9_9TELE|nr:Ubiquitin carboxyl-terminal hydrolase 10-A [Triplophysa tibetana]
MVYFEKKWIQMMFLLFDIDALIKFLITHRVFLKLKAFRVKRPTASLTRVFEPLAFTQLARAGLASTLQQSFFQHIRLVPTYCMAMLPVKIVRGINVQSIAIPSVIKIIIACRGSSLQQVATSKLRSILHTRFNILMCKQTYFITSICCSIEPCIMDKPSMKLVLILKVKKDNVLFQYRKLHGTLCNCPLRVCYTLAKVRGLNRMPNSTSLGSSAQMREDYQHIEFGVDEAPEFILGCQPSQKALPTATPVTDIPDEGSGSNSTGVVTGGVGDRASLSTSSSSSQSSGVAHFARTAEQHAEPPALESPELLGNGGHSTSPSSPVPPSAAVATPTVNTISATADEREAEGSGEANGLPETTPPAETADRLQDSSETADVRSASSVTPLPVDSEVQQVVLPAPPAAPAANPPKSWASLFHNAKPLPGGPQAYVEVKSVPAVVTVTPVASELPEKAPEVHEGPVPVSEDPMAPKLAEIIENVKLIHKPVSLQPRGLINKGNWCYINATLQALIACPPMYHLMKYIPLFSEVQRPCTSTPMMDNFIRLVNEFSNMPVPSKTKQQAVGDKIMKDIRPGTPFEPTYIYKLLTLIKSSLSEKGRQEDAEEYLGFILNGLHEEMVALKKLISPEEEKAPTPNGPESLPGVEEDAAEKQEDGSEDEWEQVGPKNKTSITRQADFIRTPITDIFGGLIRSVVYQQSSKESATLQPFFTLQLDIQSEKIRTVQEALEILVARESVQGYTTKSKQEIEISRRVTLEELPPVLVLHLKRFVFEKTGGCQKLIKNIDYPVDLEISKDLLSPGVRGKTLKGQRTYRLFAVVYHHGNSATGGHYTTDVFHIGLNGWLRIDDQAVKIINQHQVVKQTAERTAYLLYYRRVDLL